jgi:O-antigen ligase
MKIIAAVILWLTIVYSIVMMWDPARWSVSIPEVAVFAVAALLLMGSAVGWRRPAFSKALVPLATIALWGLLQIWSGDTVYQWKTRVAVLYWAANAALFFAALQAFADGRIRRRFLDALLIFGVIIAVLSPLQSLDPATKVLWIFPQPANLATQFGPFPYKNQYEAFVELLLPYALYRAVTGEKRGSLYSVAVALLYASGIAASSRMGFLLTTAEMIVVPSLVMRRQQIPFRRIQNGLFFFAAILVMLAAAAGPSILASRLSDSDPYAGRREYTEASLAMIRDRPVFGFGLGTWSAVYPGYATSDDGLFINQAHDDWAQWAAEGGLPFAALLLAVAVWSARRGWRTAWGLGVAAVFVHCSVDYPIQRTGVALVMFTMMAALAAQELEERKPGTALVGETPGA